MASPSFSGPAVIESDNGAALLEWSSQDEDVEYEVERVAADDQKALLVYRGSLPSAHVSGLLEGEHRFSVRARNDSGWTEWSAPHSVRVVHHPMALVWTLFGLGGLVFVSTAGFLWRQARRSDP